MTRLTARECGCVEDYYGGRKRPERCGCGNRLLTDAQLNPKPRKPARASEKRAPEARRRGSTLKQGRGFAASKAQQDKVRGLPCASCGREQNDYLAVDPAHLWPRGNGGCDSADCVIPLCRDCHRRLDDPSDQFELLPALIDRGYWKELAHVIEAHQISPTLLVQRVTADREPVA